MKKKSVIIFISLIFLSCGKSDKPSDKKLVIPDNLPEGDKKPKKVNLKSSKAGQRLLPRLKLKKAELALSKGQYSEALGLYDELLKLSSLGAESRSQLFAGRAEALFYLKKYEDSIAAWEKVLAIRKDDPFPLHNIALVYREAGKLKKAVRFLEDCLKKDPMMIIARIDLIDILKSTGADQKELINQVQLLDKARENINSLLKKSKDSAEIVKYLNILQEIPGERVELSILKRLMDSKSSFVREKTAYHIMNHQDGKNLLSGYIEKEKDEKLKKKFEKILKETASDKKNPAVKK
ncbi:MAG: tetratricopeptide repeat protein [Deltaproteobacteria bacterium]|nr:tetratricopeptide repeat protein [Deltaproteobacteria bacterium]